MPSAPLVPVFTVSELHEAFRLVVDAPTARRMTIEWLDCRGYRVQEDRVLPEVEDSDEWPELEDGEEEEECHGEASHAIITSHTPSPITDASEAFVRACGDALIAHTLSDSMYATARSYLLIDQLVVVAFPAAAVRYRQPGVSVPQVYETETERLGWIRMFRQMLGLGLRECLPCGQLVASAPPE